MKFEYSAYDKLGKAVNGVVEANTEPEAREQVRDKGLFVKTLGKSSDSKRLEVKSGKKFKAGGNNVKSVSGFARQLSMLVSANTPLVEAVQAVQRQSPPGPFYDALTDIVDKLEQGSSLSDGMAAHPKIFDSVARSLVRAGESGGQLAELLQRLAVVTRQQEKMRSALLGAMVYPCLLICIAVSVVLVMMLFVLPRFEALFGSLGAALPPTTKVMMAISHFLKSYWFIAFPAAAGVITGIVWSARSKWGRERIDGLMLNLPQVGLLTRSFCTARVARMLGVLLEGRVALLEALTLTREAVSNSYFRRMVHEAEEAVEHGETLSGVFDRSGLILPSVVEAVRNGERSGKLSEVLTQMADVLDEDNELLLKSVSSLIEPVILLILGVVVGFVALSLFVPLFDLTSLTQSGGGGK